MPSPIAVTKGFRLHMKICLFTASFLPKVAGMEIVIDRLAREYIAMGHEIVVLAKTISCPMAI